MSVSYLNLMFLFSFLDNNTHYILDQLRCPFFFLIYPSLSNWITLCLRIDLLIKSLLLYLFIPYCSMQIRTELFFSIFLVFSFSSSELVSSLSTAKAWKLDSWGLQDCWGGLFAMMFRFFLSFLSDFHSIHKDSCHIASVLWYSVVVTKFYGKMRDFHRNDC